MQRMTVLAKLFLLLLFLLPNFPIAFSAGVLPPRRNNVSRKQISHTESAKTKNEKD